MATVEQANTADAYCSHVLSMTAFVCSQQMETVRSFFYHFMSSKRTSDSFLFRICYLLMQKSFTHDPNLLYRPEFSRSLSFRLVRSNIITYTAVRPTSFQHELDSHCLRHSRDKADMAETYVPPHTSLQTRWDSPPSDRMSRSGTMQGSQCNGRRDAGSYLCRRGGPAARRICSQSAYK